MKTRKVALIIGILIALSILVFSCRDKKTTTNTNATMDSRPIPVKVVQVEEKLTAVPIHTAGMVYSQQESSLGFKTGGIIKTVFVGNGERVREGQLLAQLDLSEVRGSHQKAEVAFEKAKRDLKRIENLYQEQVVTLEALENSRTAFSVASSDLDIAAFNLRHSTIKAPSDGLILRKLKEPGELTNVGTPIFEFAGTRQNWIIKCGLVDTEVVKINLGDTANVFFDAFPNQSFKGTLTKISNAPDRHQGTYEIEVELVKTPERLKKGFIAKIDLIPSEKLLYKILPIESLAEANQNDGTIYKLEANQAKKVKVKIEAIMNDKVLVFGDIESNDRIIADGLADIGENSTVEIFGEPN